MNPALRLLLMLCLAVPAFGQRTETYLGLNAGLFASRGASAEPDSQFNLAGNDGYTNNPFGARNGFCYGLSYQLQRVARTRFIIGLSLGYESLRSQSRITAVNEFAPTATQQKPVSGRANLVNQFVNVFPYLGYRFSISQTAIDLSGGMDVGYLLQAQDVGSATAPTGETYRVSRERPSIRIDLRPRLQLTAYRGRLGVYGGYALGLVNYRSGYVGGVNQCYASLIRFGMLYKLKG